MTVYTKSSQVAGMVVVSGSSVRSWDGWPDDVRETLRWWNRKGKLSFGNRSYWGCLATGFYAFTLKCVGCKQLFNSSGSTACLFYGLWHCDDCMIAIARAADEF